MLSRVRWEESWSDDISPTESGTVLGFQDPCSRQCCRIYGNRRQAFLLNNQSTNEFPSSDSLPNARNSNLASKVRTTRGQVINNN